MFFSLSFFLHSDAFHFRFRHSSAPFMGNPAPVWIRARNLYTSLCVNQMQCDENSKKLSKPFMESMKLSTISQQSLSLSLFVSRDERNLKTLFYELLHLIILIILHDLPNKQCCRRTREKQKYFRKSRSFVCFQEIRLLIIHYPIRIFS